MAWEGPLLALSADGGQLWELSTFFHGLEYFGRGQLGRDEIRAVASGVPRPELDRWRWIAMPAVGAPRSLPIPARPTSASLARVAEEVVSLFPIEPETLPMLDRVEVWLCDPSTREPLARSSTALSLERALGQTHVGPFQVVEPWRQTFETMSFQHRLNARLNCSQVPGRYRFLVRRV